MIKMTPNGLACYDSEGRITCCFGTSTNSNIVWDKENPMIKERGDNYEININD